MLSEMDSTSFSDIIINKILYIISDEKIIGYNLYFKPLWEISISQYNLANIFVFKDKLYLLKYENDIYTTLAFKNGKLESTYEDLGGHQVICSGNKIYYLSGDNVKIWDLETDSIITWNTQKILEENKIGYLYFPKWAINKGKIIFSQSRGADMHSGSNGATFGILDPEKKELLCSIQLAKSYGIIGGIQVSDDTVYLNTQSGALLVYEIEK